jgi:hypothetical protein
MPRGGHQGSVPSLDPPGQEQCADGSNNICSGGQDENELITGPSVALFDVVHPDPMVVLVRVAKSVRGETNRRKVENNP